MYSIEVAYVQPHNQIVLPLDVKSNTTVREAIMQSGILQQCPDIDLQTQAVGIYGKVVSLDTRVAKYDRIEIYRDLTMDPKQARLLRT